MISSTRPGALVPPGRVAFPIGPLNAARVLLVCVAASLCPVPAVAAGAHGTTPAQQASKVRAAQHYREGIAAAQRAAQQRKSARAAVRAARPSVPAPLADFFASADFFRSKHSLRSGQNRDLPKPLTRGASEIF